MSREKVVATFDRWVEEGRDAGLEREHSDVVGQVIQRLEVRPGERILDLGCGNGWATRLLAQLSAGVQAIGIDASPKMIARAEELHSLTIRARYEQAAFEELPFKDGHFDRVFSMEALYYAADLERSLSECFRVTKAGGTIDVLVDYYEESAASAPWAEVMGLPLHRLSAEDWQAALQRAGFVEAESSRVIDSRGPGDPGAGGDECVPDHEARRALHAAGTLWIHARKPK